MSDNLERQFADSVREAAAARRSLRIRGGGSKDFYGLPAGSESVLDTHSHCGVVDYEPTELVVTVRGGTPLAELEQLLAASGQWLAFEPPHFGAAEAVGGTGATVGGMVAAGLSGPRRASAGAVRDFVLGARLLDGRGEALSFGGQVMKNVAGYDVSRALAGSMGTLGLILEVSLKTLPRPAVEATLRLELPEARAIAELNRWAGRPLPLSASAWTGNSGESGAQSGRLCVRLSGASAAVAAAREKIGGEKMDDGEAAAFWIAVREHTHVFFARAARDGLSLWRLSVPPATPAPPLRAAVPGETLIEWGGALRWFASNAEPALIRDAAARHGGHATLFRAPDELRRAAGVFQPLAAPLMDIHRRLKASFDPQGVFNPGRMYPDL